MKTSRLAADSLVILYTVVAKILHIGCEMEFITLGNGQTWKVQK
jgi:hypothetical protein